MAFTVTRRWVNPPNYDEAQNVGLAGVHTASVILTGTSDATADVTEQELLNPAILNNVNGVPCTKIAIEHLEFDVSGGLNHVALAYDRAPSDEFIRLSPGNNEYAFDPPLADTGEVGDGTPKVIFSTSGAEAADRFTIKMRFRVT